MIARRFAVVGAAILCACALVFAGCDSARTSGLHPIKVDDEWGYIDKSGAIIVPVQFDYAEPFHEGLARVRVKGGPNGSSIP